MNSERSREIVKGKAVVAGDSQYAGTWLLPLLRRRFEAVKRGYFPEGARILELGPGFSMLEYPETVFDGAFAFPGALDPAADLETVAFDLSVVLKPGAHVVLGMEKPDGRLRGDPWGKLVARFAAGFVPVQTIGLSVFLPALEDEGLINEEPWGHALDALDQTFGGLWPFSQLGHEHIIVFKRKPTPSPIGRGRG